MFDDISPVQSIDIPRWNPNEKLLKNNIFAVIGCAKNGKTTFINSFETDTLKVIETVGSELKNAPKADGEKMQAITFECFTEIHPAIRNQIDFIIFCGVPSKRDVARVHERYQHLIDVNLLTFQKIINVIIHNYNCLIIDISQQVRIGNEKASFYSYRAEIE